MKHRNSTDEVHLPRTLGPVCEGTPSFEDVQFSGSLATSKITLRFHYYQDSVHDQQAIGVFEGSKYVNDESQLQGYDGMSSIKIQDSKLTDVSFIWSTKAEWEANKAIQKLGFKGNIGSRNKFTWNHTDYHLLESQKCIGCWDKWHILLVDSNMMPIVVLPITTPGHSKSFANPNIFQMPDKYLITYFMPSQGNAPKEVGDLIYEIKVPGHG